MTPLDPRTDLVLERVVDVAPELVWKAWTTPEYLKQWFTPAPWKTVGCEIDLRPGGKFHTVMESPEGQQLPNTGCYLEVVPNERLVWTSALAPGYRPQVDEMPFTAIVELQPTAGGTRYRAVAVHQSSDHRRSHEEMGFQEGWGMALDQLVSLAKTL